MGTQRAHVNNSISITYVRSDFIMGTQRAHGGHAKDKPNALNINDL